MPGKVKVKIVAGRNLPVMDRSSDTTDAYVEIKLGNTTFKTDVCRKSLNPQWNSEWYRFEVDDAELQDEPLQIRLMDHDTYSANDAIGKVYLDLNPLLLPSASSSSKAVLSDSGPPSSSHLSAGNTVSGWFPVYDTMHGIRGEVNVIVKVELFSDFNKFRQSSCGVQFFNSSTIPHGYHAQIVHGMVEELVVSDDPEYQWIDKIRTPRASNEARQTLFFKLSGEVQRRIGLKVLDLGGNSVIGYLQCFDLEAECGIVVRGLGTAVTLVRLQEPATSYQYMEDVIPASPLRQSPPLELVHTKGLLAPDNRRVHRSKSPQPPFVGYKPKRLKHHKHKFIDNVPEYDNISLKVLFEQEDMRGEPISNRKKIFERLSSFPKRKLRALRTTSGLVLSKKVPYFRSKSEGVASSLIRSIMDNTAFSLDLVPEAEEHSDARSDTDSVIHPLKYDDGHLIPMSSSSSDSSSSESDDISDISSSVSTSTQEYSRRELVKEKNLHMLTSNNKSASFDNSISSSKIEDELSDKDDFEFSRKSNDFTSTVHIMLTPDIEFGDHRCNQFSSLVEFTEETSLRANVMKNPTGPLVKQLCFDETYSHGKYHNLHKRSNTPPISEMDPYIDYSRRKVKYSNKTVPSSLAPIQVLVTQPSLDEDFRTRPVTNLSFPSSVCFLPNVTSKNHSNNEPQSLHPVDTTISNNLCMPVENPVHVECSVDKIKEAEKIFDIRETYGYLSSEPTKANFPSESAENVGSCDTIDKILNNPFKFPLLDSESKMNITETLDRKNNIIENINKHEDCENGKIIKEENTNDLTQMNSVESIVKEIVERKFLAGRQGLLRSEARDNVDDKKQNHSLESISCPENNSDISKTIKNEEETNNVKHILDSDSFIFNNELAKTFSRGIFTVGNIESHENPESKSDETSVSSDDILLNDFSSFPFGVKEGPVFETTTKEKEFKENKIHPGRKVTETAFAGDVDCGLRVFASTSTNLVCDTKLPIPSPLMKSHSASGLCQASLPSSRTVPEESSVAGLQSINAKVSQSPIKVNNAPAIHRRSSDSDLSITPKGNSLTSSGDRSSMVGGSGGKIFQPICSKLSMKREPLEAMEFPFLTMSKFPHGFIINIAGTVSSRSVKLLERVSNLEEPESRDTWWTELRMEVRSHMRAMSCNAVLGYSETTTICDDVCVLSACGTAAIVNVRPASQPVSDTPEPPLVPPPGVKKDANMNNSQENQEIERHNSISQCTPVKPEGKTRHHSDSMDQPDVNVNSSCSMCHLPFNPTTVPLSMTAIKCSICRKKKVPDLLLATVEPPEGLPVVGRSCLIHVFVTRPKAHARGEMNACVVSDSLPFIEYDIYKQLVNKLKVNGMNSIFGLKTQICLGERMIAAVTSGTAMFLEALPVPSIPTITPGEACTQDARLATVLRGLQETIKKNRDFYHVKTTASNGQDADNNQNIAGSDSEESEDDLPDMDIHAGNKDACVFMVDDEQDIEVVSQLIDPHPPEGFLVTATEALPGLEELEVVRNLQMFTQIWRSRIPSSQPTSTIHKNFHKLLQGIYYKLRRMTPCAVGNIQFRLALPEPDELQISIVGMAVGLGESIKNFKSVRRRTVGASSKPEPIKKKLEDGDMIFSLEEDQEFNNSQMMRNTRPKSPVRPTRQSTHLPPKERYGVDMTPLSYVPGGRIEKYLGNLNFFFIRETSCIREGGGMSGFVHSFVAEVLAIVRAHVTALGGNALVAFFLNECVILNNPHKNHGQCLINVGGDVVSVSYLD